MTDVLQIANRLMEASPAADREMERVALLEQVLVEIRICRILKASSRKKNEK